LNTNESETFNPAAKRVDQCKGPLRSACLEAISLVRFMYRIVYADVCACVCVLLCVCVSGQRSAQDSGDNVCLHCLDPQALGLICLAFTHAFLREIIIWTRFPEQ
jgi:hypothetical protein